MIDGIWKILCFVPIVGQLDHDNTICFQRVVDAGQVELPYAPPTKSAKDNLQPQFHVLCPAKLAEGPKEEYRTSKPAPKVAMHLPSHGTAESAIGGNGH